ncbi:MAG: hypothetical protein ABIF08_00605 [Nanoarchaeota archaeon]
MENTFFDEEFSVAKYLALCPKCNTKFNVDLDNTEIVCECGEEFCVEPIVSFTEDFVWHPSILY